MDGIHDVGGMDGFGSLDAEGGNADPGGDDHGGGYDPFHDRWEGVTYSLFVATLGNGIANIDEFRHSIERMDPDRYLRASYYDRWVTGLSRLLVETGTIDAEDFWLRTAAFAAGEGRVPERTDPELLGELTAGVADAYGFERDSQEPRFEVGAEVRVRNHHPEGHTRCPRYVRRARGVVTTHRGTFTLPDANAHDHSAAEPLYEVRFDARELWGEESDPNLTVTLDLWESYLVPFSPESDTDTDADSGDDPSDDSENDDPESADNDR